MGWTRDLLVFSRTAHPTETPRPWSSRTGIIFPWLHSTVEICKIRFPLHGEVYSNSDVQNVWQNETYSGVVFYENFGHRLISDYSANSKDPDQSVRLGTLLCATVPKDSFSGQWRSWPFHYEKLPIQIYNFTSKNWKFSNKKKTPDIFHISAQNIDCGYSLEPPHKRQFAWNVKAIFIM